MCHINRLSKLFVLIVSICLPMYATKTFAWGAVAAWDGRVTFVSYNKVTPQFAKESALKGCEDAAMRRCEILGDAAFGTALITAQSVNLGGVVFIGDRNPLEAAKKAMRNCKIQYGDCVIISAVWDGGPKWWSIASAEDGWQISLNNGTEEDAKNDALNGCEKQVSIKGSCKIESSGSGRGYVALAGSENRTYAGYGNTKEKAEKAALKDCGGKGCKITASELNEGMIPPPTAMKQVEKMAAEGVDRMRKLGRLVN